MKLTKNFIEYVKIKYPEHETHLTDLCDHFDEELLRICLESKCKEDFGLVSHTSSAMRLRIIVEDEITVLKTSNFTEVLIKYDSKKNKKVCNPICFSNERTTIINKDGYVFHKSKNAGKYYPVPIKNLLSGYTIPSNKATMDFMSIYYQYMQEKSFLFKDIYRVPKKQIYSDANYLC